MTRMLAAVDRVLTLVLGLALLALAVAAVDWKYQLFGDYRDTLRTSAADDVLDTGWWPWAFAAGGLVLGLLGLWLALAHVRRLGASTLRLSDSGETGRIEVDLRGVADAAAAHFATFAPVTKVSGRPRKYGARHLIELRGDLAPFADADTIVTAAEACSEHLAEAFPHDQVGCRILLDPPRTPGRGRGTHARVE